MEKGKLKQNGVHLEEHEYNTVKYLLESGYDVELIPPSKIKHLQMPDIILQGVPWEMKSPVEAGKYTIKNIVQNASHQSVNIIIYLRRCKMMDDEGIRKIRHYFDLSKRIRRVKIITKTAEIIDFSK